LHSDLPPSNQQLIDRPYISFSFYMDVHHNTEQKNFHDYNFDIRMNY